MELKPWNDLLVLHYAKIMMERGQRRVAVAYDPRNRNFTESWFKEWLNMRFACILSGLRNPASEGLRPCFPFTTCWITTNAMGLFAKPDGLMGFVAPTAPPPR
ncbi:MAG: hypothetical protein RKR03_00585 [Candidatus Competibacter sp.]|nr:hypothetical protein [Candidatus Competibacter sp.]